jgi:biotin-dependent carboxylase-like uncharacterized protein
VIAVTRALGLVTVQDAGWATGRAIGLPRCGAADQEALELANLLVGNRPGAAAIEVAAGGVSLSPDVPLTAALAGAAAAWVDGTPLPPCMTLAVPAGATLRVEADPAGRFGYLALRGGIDVPALLGARSTYLPTGLGGLEGRRLQAGDMLAAGDQTEGRAPPAGFVAPPGPPPASGPLALIPGPQLALFPGSSQAVLTTAEYVVTGRSDRMGTRLTGPPVPASVTARLPSEGTCVGAMQVPDDGQPIVILVDGPTVGGYPKVGAVAGADLSRFVQVPVGGRVRFGWMGVAEAQAALYVRRAALAARSAAIRRAGA